MQVEEESPFIEVGAHGPPVSTSPVEGKAVAIYTICLRNTYSLTPVMCFALRGSPRVGHLAALAARSSMITASMEYSVKTARNVPVEERRGEDMLLK
jgi:hypothetical protein